jgi:hypothetical protein
MPLALARLQPKASALTRPPDARLTKEPVGSKRIMLAAYSFDKSFRNLQKERA